MRPSPSVAAVAAMTLVLTLAGAAPARSDTPARDDARRSEPAPSVEIARRGEDAEAVPLADRGWVWPADPFRLARPYLQPPHRYGAGHRGVDLTVDSGAVRTPAPGTVAFVGAVAGRDLITIDHGDGLVTTLEPVHSELSAGAAVDRGDPVGTLATGGHAAAGTVHFGVRLHGEYINPLLLLGGVPRAVLLPCC